jgi:flavin reductase (DIM6/NTAB) family NADH-FMN oxidoreductase RutF
MAMEQAEPTPEQIRAFRDTCGRFATGVTVICAKAGDEVHGMTANAFMSVSVNPFLVAVSVTQTTRMHALLTPPAARFTISILSKGQRYLSEAFAGKRGRRPVAVPFKTLDDGQVILDQAVAWLSCQKVQEIPVADHTLFIGRVLSFGYTDSKDPLVFYGGTYYPGLEWDPMQEIEWVFRL